MGLVITKLPQPPAVGGANDDAAVVAEAGRALDLRIGIYLADYDQRTLGPLRAEAAAELDIETSVANEEKGTYREVFSKELRPLLMIGMLLAMFQQMTGINSIMYYAPIIFQKIGNGTSSALMQTIAVGAVNLTFTIVSLKLIDRWGRKPLLIVGALGMTISLGVIAGAFFMHHFAGYFILVFILLFIASFAVSIGPVAWVVIAEIFPNKLRSKAMSVAIVTLWTFTFLVSLTFPIILDRLGGGAAFTMFGVMCVLLLLYVIFKLPETKGKSLEELERILLKK